MLSTSKRRGRFVGFGAIPFDPADGERLERFFDGVCGGGSGGGGGKPVCAHWPQRFGSPRRSRTTKYVAPSTGSPFCPIFKKAE